MYISSVYLHLLSYPEVEGLQLALALMILPDSAEQMVLFEEHYPSILQKLLYITIDATYLKLLTEFLNNFISAAQIMEYI